MLFQLVVQVRSAVVPFSSKQIEKLTKDCHDNDLSCTMLKVDTFLAEGGTFCGQGDAACLKEQLTTNIKSLHPPYSQYVPVLRTHFFDSVDPEMVASPVQSLVFKKLKHIIKDDESKLKVFRYDAKAALTKFPGMLTDSKGRRNRRTVSEDSAFCIKQIESSTNLTMMACEHELLVHRILFCSTYLYMAFDPTLSGKSGNIWNQASFEDLSDSLISYDNNGDDSSGGNEHKDYIEDSNDDMIQSNDTEAVLANMQLVHQDGHTIGVSDQCFANLVDQIVDETLPTNTVELPSASFVCEDPNDYRGDLLTSYGRMSCDKAIYTLMGVRPFPLDVNNLKADSCNENLMSPVGTFFNDTVQLGVLILSAGQQCCTHGAKNPVCNEWGMTTLAIKTGNVTNDDDTPSEGDFSWDNYRHMYNNGEAWVVPVIVMFSLLVCVALCIIWAGARRSAEGSAQLSSLVRSDQSHQLFASPPPFRTTHMVLNESPDSSRKHSPRKSYRQSMAEIGLQEIMQESPNTIRYKRDSMI